MAQPSQIKKSPYGTRPQDLKAAAAATATSAAPQVSDNPVDLYNSLRTVDSGAAQAAPQPIPQQAPAEQSPEDLYKSLMSEDLGAGVGPRPGPDEITFGARAAAGFASNDAQKDAYLRKRYGTENVAHMSDGWKVKVKGKWTPFNENVLGMGDPANLVAQGVTEVGALPAEAASVAMAGTAAAGSGGVGLASAPMILAGGRALGGAMGSQLRYAVADLIGIPTEEKTTGDMILNRAIGSANEGLMRAIVGHAFDWGLSRGIPAATNAVARMRGNAPAALSPEMQAAVEAVNTASAPMRAQLDASLAMLRGKSPLNSLKPEDEALAGVADAVKVNRAAREVGINLTPDQLFPNDRNLTKVADAALSSPKLQEARMLQGQQAVAVVRKLDESFGASERTAKDVVREGNFLDRAWGTLIGNFRKRAIENAEAPTRELSIPNAQYTQQGYLPEIPGKREMGLPEISPKVQGSKAQKFRQTSQNQNTQALLEYGQQQFLGQGTAEQISLFGEQAAFEPGKVKTISVTNLGQKLQALREQLGFSSDGKRPPIGRLKEIEQSSNLSGVPGKTAYLIQRVDELSREIENKNGQFEPRKLDMLYRELKRAVDSHYDPNAAQQSRAFYVLKELKDGVRDDFTNGIASFLGPEERQSYLAAMQRFSELKTAKQDVKGLFAEDSPTVSSIIEYLRSRNLKSGDKISSLKKIIQQDDPEGWDVLGRAYFKRFMADYEMSGAKGQRLGYKDWTKISKALNEDKGTVEQMVEIIGKDRTSELINLARTMSAVQERDAAFETSPGLVMRLLKTMTAVVKLNPSEVAEAINSNAAATKLLNSEQASLMIRKFPLKERVRLQQLQALAFEHARWKQERIKGLTAQNVDAEIRNMLNPAPTQEEPSQ